MPKWVRVMTWSWDVCRNCGLEVQASDISWDQGLRCQACDECRQKARLTRRDPRDDHDMKRDGIRAGDHDEN
jgi:DNA-directed RNA polymerase subunit RPC12/RpoP